MSRVHIIFGLQQRMYLEKAFCMARKIMCKNGLPSPSESFALRQLLEAQ
jgi:hypothetical protein